MGFSVEDVCVTGLVLYTEVYWNQETKASLSFRLESTKIYLAKIEVLEVINYQKKVFIFFEENNVFIFSIFL